MAPKKIPVEGKRFGRLLVIGPSDQGYNCWLCICDCGNEKHVYKSNLLSGGITSCGCLRRELSSKRMMKHGKKRTPEYNIYHLMLKRCYNKSDGQYSNYGGRGIKVCKRWRESFLAFYHDMGPRPISPFGSKRSRYSIERRNNNKNYNPSNCFWATLEQQANNRRNNIYIRYKGKRQSISNWARELGIHALNTQQRIRRGMNPIAALEKGLSDLLNQEKRSLT